PSRGRHTRSSRDWSSDVCSSDLPKKIIGLFSSGLHDHNPITNLELVHAPTFRSSEKKNQREVSSSFSRTRTSDSPQGLASTTTPTAPSNRSSETTMTSSCTSNIRHPPSRPRQRQT